MTDEEFDAHLDHAADAFERLGHSPAEARRLAHARFGSRVAARELVHEARGWPALERAWTDLRYAWRGLRRDAAFTLGAVAVLSLGIGVNVAVFTVARAALFKGFAGVPGQDGLVYLTTGRDCCVSYQDLRDWREGARTLSAVAAVADRRVAFDADHGAETATATEVTANTFSVLGVQPAMGRDFNVADDAPGAAAVAILGNRFWRQRLGADSDVLGRVVRINGVPTTIVGVMGADVVFPQNQDLWMPLGARLADQPRDARGLWFAVARLAPGVSVDEARADLDIVGARLEREYPQTNAGIRPWVHTFTTLFVGLDAAVVYGALWAGVGVLLLVTCANIASLLLARSLERIRDAGLRLALGAGPARVIRQQVCEALLLAGWGGVIGTALAWALLQAYRAVAVPPTQPWSAQLLDYRLDIRVAAYAMAITAVTGLAVAIAPAVRVGRTNPMVALRDGGRGSAGARTRRRSASGLVAAQVMLTVVLLSGAAVLARSFLIVQTRPLGFDPSPVLTALTMLPTSRYPDAAARFRFLDEAGGRLASMPGIRSVAFSDAGVAQRGGRLAIDVEGQPVVSEHRPQVRSIAVSPGYFATLGAPLLSGRDFDERDGTGTRLSAIVSHSFARAHWRAGAAVGSRVRFYASGEAGPWLTIVAIAPDLRQGDPAQAAIDPVVYVPLRQRPSAGTWVLASASVAPEGLIGEMRRRLQEVDPEVPLWLGPYTLADWRAGSYWRRGVTSALSLIFALTALTVAAVGLFALLAQDVARRSRELAIRMAIGASAAGVRWLVVRGGLTPVLAGLAAGLVVSLGTNRLLRGQLVDVSAWDPVALSIAAALLLLAALAGCLLPARRATRTDPLLALRLE